MCIRDRKYYVDTSSILPDSAVLHKFKFDSRGKERALLKEGNYVNAVTCGVELVGRIKVNRDVYKRQVKQLLAPMKIRLEEIKTTDLRQSIGDLAEGKKNVLIAPFTGSAPQESLMVFCGVNEKHFDKILFELRRKQIPVDYKACLLYTSFGRFVQYRNSRNGFVCPSQINWLL